MNDSTATLRENIFLPGSVTESCHASTVLPLPGGRVAAAWFGGSAEGKDDVKIYVSVREKSGWQKPVCVHVPGNEEPHWNPALFLRLDGSVCLYFKFGKFIPEWRTFAAISADGCKSFGEPFELVPGDCSGGRGPVKNKPIRLSDGTVLAPASKETALSWRCFVDCSDDDGRTFTHSGFVPRPKKGGRPVGMIQPTLWEDENGVHLLARSNAGALYRSDSRDQGEHWGKAYETSLPNPNSGVDLSNSDFSERTVVERVFDSSSFAVFFASCSAVMRT